LHSNIIAVIAQVLANGLRQALGWNDHVGLTRSAEQSANAALSVKALPDAPVAEQTKYARQPNDSRAKAWS
jgi:hypothetical protein